MAIYIANENGDWWEFTPDECLYVLDTEKLTADQKEYLEDDYDIEESNLNELVDLDKFEKLIWEIGVGIPTSKLLGGKNG